MNGIITKYVYENNKLKYEINEDGIVKYIYSNGEPVGFTYDDKTYFYIFDNDRITGIKHGETNICKYVYDGDAIKIEYESEEYAEKIGEINSLRYEAEYVDLETGWVYSNGRYIDEGAKRYIDGISRNDVYRYAKNGEITFEILNNIYELDFLYDTVASRASVYSYNSATESEQIRIIARVIYFESSANALDQIGVAQVIQNRMNIYGKTAYEVVTQAGQFAALKKALGSGTTDGELWSQALENASRLYWNQALVYTRKKFENATSFRALKGSLSSNPVQFKSVNGVLCAKLVSGTTIKYSPIQYTYCPAGKYASKYIDSYDTLKAVYSEYGAKNKYNVFFGYK